MACVLSARLVFEETTIDEVTKILQCYHLVSFQKVHVVEDALRSKCLSMVSLAILKATRYQLVRVFQTLVIQFIQLGVLKKGGELATIDVRSIFLDKFKASHFKDVLLNKIQNKVVHSKAREATLDASNVLRVEGRVCVPRVDDFSSTLLVECHDSLHASA